MTFVCLVSVCKRLCNVRTRSIMCLHLMFMLRSCSVRFPFANGGMQTLHKRLKNVCVLGEKVAGSTSTLTKGKEEERDPASKHTLSNDQGPLTRCTVLPATSGDKAQN